MRMTNDEFCRSIHFSPSRVYCLTCTLVRLTYVTLGQFSNKLNNKSNKSSKSPKQIMLTWAIIVQQLL